MNLLVFTVFDVCWPIFLWFGQLTSGRFGFLQGGFSFLFEKNITLTHFRFCYWRCSQSLSLPLRQASWPGTLAFLQSWRKRRQREEVFCSVLYSGPLQVFPS